MNKPVSQTERKNKEIRRIFRIIILAFRRAGIREKECKEGVLVFHRPQVKVILKHLDQLDVDPELIIRHWR
jgi:uncharacterized protein involved in tellurium resistance